LESDVDGDGLVAADGDVFDEQADHAFAFPQWGGRVVPQCGEVGGEGGDALPLRVGEGGCAGFGAFVGVGGFGQLAQGVVPVGFQGVGDEPVGGVDGEVAAAGLLGVVLGALHGAGA